jgi:hypothetical protein
MSTQDPFAAKLAAILAARAETAVRPEAVERVRNADYRPRAHFVRTPVALGVLAGTAGAATAATVVLLGSAAPAYAGWSATPTDSAAVAGPSTAASCQSQLSSMASPGGSSSDSGNWQNVLTDVRGPFTVALYQNGNDYAACFTGPSFTEISQIDSDGSSVSGSSSVRGSEQSQHDMTRGSTSFGGSTASGNLEQVTQSSSTSSDGAYTLVDGRTKSGVTGVTLVRDDGQDVVATVADGWFVAWWPGNATVTAAQVTTAAATTTEPLVSSHTVPTPPQPGACPPSTSNPTTQTGQSVSCSGSSGGPSTSAN